MNIKLKEIQLKGYKSIGIEGQSIPMKDITVLLGANGAGKSNFVSFFSMLNSLTEDELQNFIGENGTANSLLYYGIKQTKRLETKLIFANKNTEITYKFNLKHAAGDTLIFSEEVINWLQKVNKKPSHIHLSSGRKESDLINRKEKECKTILQLLRNCRVFQFHDTSAKSNIRNKGYINDNRFLNSDAGNLAAFLYAMKHKKSGNKYYQRVVRYIRQIMPQFADFELYPSALNENYIILNWKENKSSYLFGAHQISDGSLRFMALATLLLQPPETLPSVMILDEPELGLHPSAISSLAGMVKSASKNCQIVLATQSTRLVDEFETKNIIVVERDIKNDCSIFKELDREALANWVEQYSMSELWEKNVIGGKP